MTRTNDRYLAVHNLGLLQRQAGVDREVAELVTSYGRLRVDAGLPLEFAIAPRRADATERKHLDRLARLNPEAEPRFLGFVAAYCSALEASGLAPLCNVGQLASALGTSQAGLRRWIAGRDSSYRPVKIPKKDGTIRVVQSPKAPLRAAQVWIKRNVLSSQPPDPAAHGFVTSRSIFSNALPHVGKQWVVRVDFEDFFPSITFRSARKVFQRFGYPYSVACALANLCTFQGRVVQGAPTSPALSNAACRTLDRRMRGLARSIGASYTRYADDLTFSSDDRRVVAAIPMVRRIATDEGFRLNEKKTRVAGRGIRQKVTGLVVNDRVNIDRRYRRKLRAAAHRMATRGPEAVRLPSRADGQADVEAVLRGHLAFVGFVDRSWRRPHKPAHT